MFPSLKTILLLILVLMALCVRTHAFPGAEEVQEHRVCKIQVQTTTTFEGKCVRLRGQVPACQSEGYLDFQTDECK